MPEKNDAGSAQRLLLMADCHCIVRHTFSINLVPLRLRFQASHTNTKMWRVHTDHRQNQREHCHWICNTRIRILFHNISSSLYALLQLRMDWTDTHAPSSKPNDGVCKFVRVPKLSGIFSSILFCCHPPSLCSIAPVLCVCLCPIYDDALALEPL